jgi:hypothetical protein
LNLNAEEIEELIEKFEQDSKAIRNSLLEMCWHMRGSISYDDGMLLSFVEREIINKLIKEHIETTQKSGMPFF